MNGYVYKRVSVYICLCVLMCKYIDLYITLCVCVLVCMCINVLMYKYVWVY